MAFGGADGLYENARNLIDRERYDQAVRQLNDLLQRYDGKAQAVENRVDAALLDIRAKGEKQLRNFVPLRTVH